VLITDASCGWAADAGALTQRREPGYPQFERVK